MCIRDELDRQRYLIDMHLLGERNPMRLQAQAGRLAQLSRSYSSANFERDAICEMKRSLAISPSPERQAEHDELVSAYDSDIVLCPYGCGHDLTELDSEICPNCDRIVRPCMNCRAPNRLGEPFCRSCGKDDSIQAQPMGTINAIPINTDWHYRDHVFPQLSPQPIAVGDLVLIPHVGDGCLLALKQATGGLVWRLNILNDRHTSLCYVYPYVYVYSTNRIQRFMPFLTEPEPETIYTEWQQTASYPVFPYLRHDDHTIIFPVQSGLLFHNVWRIRNAARPETVYSNHGHDRIYPIPHSDDTLILSSDGTITPFDNVERKPVNLLSNGEIAGPPVSPATGDWIFFESSSGEGRKINAWSLRTKILLSQVVEDVPFTPGQLAVCPPMVYRDGVILISQNRNVVYRVWIGDGNIQIGTVEINLQAGAREVGVIDPQLSMIEARYLFSRVPDGFLFVNVDNPNNGGMVLPQITMESKPLVCGDRLILLCTDGVRCFTL